MSAPTTEPTVAARIMITTESLPRRATKPANGSTISEGIGGNTFSATTSRATPRYPNCSMTS